jgi:tRNA pseudouridine55 synthase
MKKSGILIIDKPGGVTSFDVIREVRRVVGVRKAGHTGTLDPLATGVLPVCLGAATRIAGLLTEGDKGYVGTALLGLETDTLDVTGRELARRAVGEDMTRQAVERALAALTGRQQQVPPAYSAVRADGERAYKRARRGEEVTLAPREIVVHRLELTGWEPPSFDVVIECSKGTYVRSLVAEVGRALGCGATLSALRRTRAGRFDLSQAVPLAEVGARIAAGTLELIGMDDALDQLPAVELSPEEVEGVRHGRPVQRPDARLPEGLLRLRGGGELVALGEAREGRVWPKRVFPGSTRAQEDA